MCGPCACLRTIVLHGGHATNLAAKQKTILGDKGSGSSALNVVEKVVQDLTKEHFGTIEGRDLIEKIIGGDEPWADAQPVRPAKPSLDACLNALDFEAIAAAAVSEQAWAYYSSGADDEIATRSAAARSGQWQPCPRLTPGRPPGPARPCPKNVEEGRHSSASSRSDSIETLGRILGVAIGLDEPGRGVGLAAEAGVTMAAVRGGR